MKKLIILSIAIMSFGAVFAQQRNDRGRQPQGYNQQNNNHDRDYSSNNNHGYNNRDNNWNNNQRYDNNDHRADIERVNREYDQRINGYRNDRSINTYERDRRIRQAEYERSQKANSFGKGVVVGALATVILGAILSH